LLYHKLRLSHILVVRLRLFRRKQHQSWRRRRTIPHWVGMESIFGRKKARPRQSSTSNQEDLNERSVPYHKLGPSPRTPIPVGTTSQAFRGSAVGSVISAPITNPTLTSNGTEFNIYNRPKPNKDRSFSSGNTPQTSAPSRLTNDSVGFYSESEKTRLNHHRSKHSVSEASTSSSGRRSPSMSDFGHFKPSHNSLNNQTVRPASHATARSDPRFSQYTQSVASDLLSAHSSHHLHRFGKAEEFHFPKPNDEEIEALFENIKLTRDLGDLPNLTIDQKWNMVYSQEHLHWTNERQREDQLRKQGETSSPANTVEGTPEWFIQKLISQTITQKQASSLEVSLRSNEMRYCFSPTF
jgi:cytokinesis protein